MGYSETVRKEVFALKDFRLEFQRFEVGYDLTFFRLGWVVYEYVTNAKGWVNNNKNIFRAITCCVIPM